MYRQALYRDLITHAEGELHMRLIPVRGRNLLASTAPWSQRKTQLAGGPITVTHPANVLYFMTIREAGDLVLRAAKYAMTPARLDVLIYTLNIGKPVKIGDRAEGMIGLSGL